MIVSILSEMFSRELLKLKEELALYPSESALWVVPEGIANSAGNLALHLIGNLNHFIGATLGGSGYIRQRELEFSQKNIPRESIFTQIDHTIDTVNSTLAQLSDEELDAIFPLEKHGQKVTTGYMLTHLLTHINYHLGQVNYHRRLTTA